MKQWSDKVRALDEIANEYVKICLNGFINYKTIAEFSQYFCNRVLNHEEIEMVCNLITQLMRSEL